MAERARAQERRVGADARQLEERGPDSADASLSGIEEFSRLGEKICLCSMVLRPVERLVFSPKER